jgi:RNA polymerase sigma factor (sigma-70 family)
METSHLIAFCEREHPRLVGILGLYCGDVGVAEELAQEALARACRDWRKVQRFDSPEGWVHRVALNLAHSYFRHRAAERRAQDRMRSKAALEAETGEDPRRIELVDALKGLPHRQRAAVLLRYYLDLPIAQVASLLECPEGTVKTLTHEAVKTLRATGALTQDREESDAV